MKVAIITSPNQWFIPYAYRLSQKLNCDLFFSHKDIVDTYDVVFVLSYHKLIKKEYLKAKHNVVIHASDLPKGKGWAPLFWQVLENKQEIIFSMFEIDDGVDSGDVYMKKKLYLSGYELNNELREKQAIHTINMCNDFIVNYEMYKIPKCQKGCETFYSKRKAADSKLDIDKSIKEQFNLLRIVDNDNYPAFFEIDGHKYILKIEEVEDENRKV